MSTKREARTAYYQGLKEAMEEHMITTESGLRALSGMETAEVEKIVGSVRKRHNKLMKQIDQEIAESNSN